MSLPLLGSNELPDFSGLEPPADWLEAGLPANWSFSQLLESGDNT